ncbi:MAG: hypothetical protein K0S79_1623 [Nitrospira sp.]|nr:hypothetical protein [Nitrospira sp.]
MYAVNTLLAVALSLLSLAGLAADAPSVIFDSPPLVFEVPPRFAPLAARLRKVNPQAVNAARELVGLQTTGSPISITLVPEDSEIAHQAPSWVSGYTLVPSGRIVLFPDRQISYPHGSLEGLLVHELTHVFVMRVTGSRTGPRWFEEGIAMVASGERNLEDRVWGFWVGLTATPIAVEDIDRLFGEGPPSVQKAYLLSEALVRFLMTSLGPDIPRQVLAERADGVPFEDAVQTVTGRSLIELERAFWAEQTAWRRWIPVMTSSTILWAVIMLVAWAAFRKQRQRAAVVKRQWEKEEEEGP